MMKVLQLKLNGKRINFSPSENSITESSIRSAFFIPDKSIIRLCSRDDDNLYLNHSPLPVPRFLLPARWEDMELTVEYQLDPTYHQEVPKKDRILRLQNGDKKVHIALSENSITKASIEAAFMISEASMIRLSYKDGEQLCVCQASMLPEPRFILPNEWDKLDFIVEYRSNSCDYYKKSTSVESDSESFAKLDIN